MRGDKGGRLSIVDRGAKREVRVTAVSNRFGLILLLATLGAAPAKAQADEPPLGAYNADIAASSISGISSGAFMAVQFATAWSGTIKGVGVIAGGPYYCAQGTAVGALGGNIEVILTATGPCMVGPPPAVEPLIKQSDVWAHSKTIDDTHNIASQKIYVFHGYNDAVVSPSVTDAGHRFYLHYLSDQNRGEYFLSDRNRRRPLPGDPLLWSRVPGQRELLHRPV
jgi:poly(3-hydroxybutyrate) depolymerase